jgi:hemerythrin-like domain-containing protein
VPDIRRMERAFLSLDLRYRDVLAACDRLDVLGTQIAAIPHPIDCAETLDALRAALDSAHALEDLVFMPILEARALSKQHYAAFLARLMQEHFEDACQIEEIAEALDSHARLRPILDPDAMWFLLAGFTHGLRRHIGAERHLINCWLAA